MLARAVVLLSLMIPPLTSSQRQALETADDDGPLRYNATVEALLEYVRALESRDLVDIESTDALLVTTNPDAHRGTWLRIKGRLVDHEPRAFGRDDLEAWMIRAADGKTPSVILLTPRVTNEAGPTTGTQVTAVGRFIRHYRDSEAGPTGLAESVSLVAVGLAPVVADEDDARVWFAATVALLVVVLLISFVVTKVITRSRRRFGRPRWGQAAEPPPLNEYDLPADRIEALAELRRRAERDHGSQLHE